MTRDEYCFHSI